MEILQWLEYSKIISDYEVIDYKVWDTGRFFKLTIYFKNNTVVHVKEYFDLTERNYSFHRQDLKGKLIICWDNSPHHHRIKTHPHHKHHAETVQESYDIDLKDVLIDIEKIIQTE
jgi:Family of unknown function (DUF6516)